MGAFALCPSLLLLLSSLALFCAADDRLLPDQSLTMNQSLVSNGGRFALGFFSLGTTPSRHYLGIWYNDTDMPGRTVVWVANREKPFKDSSVVLRISNQSNHLVVSTSAGRLLWSSNSSGTPPSRGSMAAVLLDTGNLELRASESNVCWQSFDHPVDTILPGMKLWIEKKPHIANKIVSWKAANDPSPGAFSYGIDPATTLQTMVWNGTLPYRRTCIWDTSQTRAGPMTAIGPAATFSIQRNDSMAYITFSPSADASVSQRIVIDRTGNVQLFYRNSSTNNWASLLWYPAAKPCDTYNVCGPYGVCRNSGSSRVCDCLDAYKPRVQSEWSRGEYSGGCVRQRAPACDAGDGFQRMANMKIPDKMVSLHDVMNESACEAACHGNCSCAAYAYASSVQSYLRENISRCLVWVGEMIDLVQYTAGEGEDFYLRVPGAGTVNKTRMLWLVLPPVLLALILCVSLSSCWKYRAKIKGWRWKNGKRTRYSSMACFSGFSRGDAQKEFSGPRDLLEDEEKEGRESDLRMFSLDAIAAATDNFSDTNKLGQGGFGDVYRGVLPCGQKIAVKRLSRSSGQGLDEFKTEVVLIAKLQHRNLVRLLGCCIEGEEKILIYEYMPNKSLDFFLFDSSRRSMLDWSKRFDIIEGIARGLLYLHRDSRVRVVHRDLKAGNILLDGEMSPKISDFGMARIFGGNKNFDSTNRVVGTFGYMPPEYAMEGLFSVKSDVYSFGVLMLEIVSGRKNNRSGLDSHTNLLGYAWQLWTVERAEEIADPCIRGSCPMQQVLRCIHIGLLCVQDRPYDRPTMSSVVIMLGSEAGINQMPKQPTFVVEGCPNETDSLKHDTDGYSVNNVTMSIVTGR